MSQTIRIHRHPLSGHSHRVELFASLAGIDHELVDVDLMTGEQKRAAFLKLNPFGQVPVIEDGETVLADSNAILVYLAKTYAATWMPTDPLGEASVQRILSIAAGEINYGPATARLSTVFGAALDTERAKSIADWAFERLERELDGRNWFVGDSPSIADVAVYSYTAHAPEGNVSLLPYPNIRSWIERLSALPGFVPMQATKVGLAA
jgi:glutathione S-transferase